MSFVTRFLSPVTSAVKFIGEAPYGSIAETVSPEEAFDTDSIEKIRFFPVVEKEYLTDGVPADEALAESVRTDIASYFSEKGFDIDVTGTKKVIPPVEDLAFGIALNFDATAPFIRSIREAASKKHFENVLYYYGSGSANEKNAAVQLAEKLSDYGILSDVFVNRSNYTIRMTISSAPKVTNFLSGDFMEIFSHSVVKAVLEDYGKEQGKETELYSNAIITADDRKNELDLVFRVEDKVFLAEIKSGKFNPDTYRLLGEHMGVVPDRLILLAAGKSNEQTEAISYFYDYYCANTGNFRTKLTEMIDKAFKEDNENE